MPPTKRLNVLVYAGSGATSSSVRHAVWSLRRLLGPAYAVLTVTAQQILTEPWPSTCALLVMPGGADMAYCRALNGEGNRRIRLFVQGGGAYLGFCAGGYYGTAKCEFEVGKGGGMEVVGDRELGFFPGISRGLAFEGFVYSSEAGARAVGLEVNSKAFKLEGAESLEDCTVYYNGGGAFVDADKYESKGVEVLARFAEPLAIDAGAAKAAVVYCKVGDGGAILTGPHPEFAGENLPADDRSHADYPGLVRKIIADDEKRTAFLKGCLTKLGLEVAQEVQPVPSLSPLHLSAARPSEIAELLQSWHEEGVLAKDPKDGLEYIKGENDTFRLQQDVPSLHSLSLSSSAKETNTDGVSSSGDSIPDYNASIKDLIPHETAIPSTDQTPKFNHATFYAHLNTYAAFLKTSQPTFGRTLLYGEVVTSTNTLLEKNISMLSSLPSGFTATANTQIAGRGRGTNVWVSPPGSLMYSVVLRHPLHLSASAPVVFVQYLAAMAAVLGIRAYNPTAASKGGYADLKVHLKWPNDIYATNPTTNALEKIGGILVHSSYAGGDYTLVCGVGINVSNAQPTTSIAQLAAAHSPPLPAPSHERLLASILAQFEALYARFTRTGFDKSFQDMYYGMWLHSGQIVTLETEGGAKARIKGISADWGLLVAEELAPAWSAGGTDRATGKMFQLQSDSNSFDFFKGLVKRKI